MPISPGCIRAGIERKDPRMVLWGLCRRFLCHISLKLSERGSREKWVRWNSQRQKRKEGKKEQSCFFWLLSSQKLRISSYWWIGLSRRKTRCSLMLKLRQPYWSLIVISLLPYILPPMYSRYLWFLSVSGCVLKSIHPYTTKETCLQAPEKSWPVPPLQDCPNCPWRHMHFSIGDGESLAEAPELLVACR